MSTVLKMEHIEKVYGNQVRALHDISLEVSAGEFVAVIGPSGSGKSTLLRTVNQLVFPSGGHVYIDGEEVTGASGKKLRLLRRKVGMIFQHYNLVQRLSVMQNVLHGRLGYMSALDGMLGNYTEEDKRKAIDLLQEIEMGDRLYNRASDLSGGQKQRVGIARAIMQEPKLLLCDEPIASLDPNASKIIMDLIYQMTQRRNIACIVNLHQLDVAMRYATRIIGLAKGEMIFDGTPQQLNNAVIEKIYNTSMENLIIKQGENYA
jgi:phosphonate transport system ATP-binding protein